MSRRPPPPSSPTSPAASRATDPDALDASPLVYLLGLAFQQLLERTQDRVGPAGYPELRPVHAFALRALAGEGVTSVELAERLGMTKQGAGKLVDFLEAHGYVERRPHALGGRRRLVALTAHGREHLEDADALMQAAEAEWGRPLGEAGVRDLRAALAVAVRAFGGGAASPLRPSW